MQEKEFLFLLEDCPTRQGGKLSLSSWSKSRHVSGRTSVSLARFLAAVPAAGSRRGFGFARPPLASAWFPLSRSPAFDGEFVFRKLKFTSILPIISLKDMEI